MEWRGEVKWSGEVEWRGGVERWSGEAKWSGVERWSGEVEWRGEVEWSTCRCSGVYVSVLHVQLYMYIQCIASTHVHSTVLIRAEAEGSG